jgi:Alpha-galactosidase
MQGMQRRRCLAIIVAFLISISLFSISTQHPHVVYAMSAENNGVGLTPALGWSSWSFIRRNPTATNIEATADAMKNSGLAGAGYQYINVDDFWYQCPGNQGPNVDEYGRWVIDTTKFPNAGSTSGIQAVADYIHKDGLKFGLYVTPGISKQAVVQNTAIEGTPYHADDIATTTVEKNYNCSGNGGMVGIDYSKPGAQEFINSWANQFAAWGIDYLKIDGVGTWDIPDLQAWSAALQQTGRPIHLELSNKLAIGSAATWAQYSNGWRTGSDIECYGCATGGSSYPLTNWSNVSSRFNQVASWQPYGGPGGFNDYDSLEVGNGSNDGLTPDERMTQMSLWAMAASPLILGTDLTNLDPTDLGYLKNTDVLAVDQDTIDASRIVNTSTTQVFTKMEPNGDGIVALFNTGGQAATISTTTSAIGMPTSGGYYLNDLWSHQKTETVGTISVYIPAHGVALYRVTTSDNPTATPPSVALDLSGLSTMTAGQTATVTESFTDNGVLPAQQVQLSLTTPSGWTVTPTSATSLGAVESGQTVQTTFQVTAPTPATLFQSDSITATANYQWHGKYPLSISITRPVVTNPPVQTPYQTFSSATDAPATFGQLGQQFGISGAGTDLYSSADAYSSIYLKGAVGTTSTIDTEVVSQQSLTGYGKAGIIVRNDITGSGTTPEGVILFVSPTGGIQLEWTNNGGTYINSVTPANNTIVYTMPVWLKLEKSGTSYTGYYSLDGKGWYIVGHANLSAQTDTQDAGIFVTSHSSGTPAQITFNGLSVSDGATPPPAGPTFYEAESSANTIAGGASVSSCAACSGGKKVGYVGNGGTLTFNKVTAPTTGSYTVVIYYLNGPPERDAMVSVNGDTPQTLSFTPTADFNTVGAMTVSLQLAAGNNTIKFSNPTAYAPDFDRISVAATPN